MIILAGISIGVLANTGLFEKAKEAKQKTNEAEQLEINRLSEYENVIEQYSGNEKNTLEPGLYNDGVMTATWSELIENDILIYSDYDNSIKAQYGKSDSLVGKLVIDNSIKIIKQSYSSAKKITEIVLPEGLETIGYCAFSNFSSLQTINIPDSVTAIGTAAFSSCTSLEKIIIPNSITNLYQQTFYNCTSLTTVTIPNSVTEIESGVFLNCSNLTDIYYTGTEEEWNAIVICDDNSELENATIHYNAVR